MINTVVIKPLAHEGVGFCPNELIGQSAPDQRMGAALTSVPLSTDNACAPVEPLYVLHGGQGKTKDSFTATYFFLPSAVRWAQVDEGLLLPSQRLLHAICWGTPTIRADGVPIAPLYLFGGLSFTGEALSDFYRFDLCLNYTTDTFSTQKTNDPLHGEWECLEYTSGPPPAMAGHSLTVRPCSSDLILFGGLEFRAAYGFASRGRELESGLHTYFYAWTEKSGWRVLRIDGGSQGVREASHQPVRRAGHAAMITNDRFYIFGGVDECHNTLSDVWEYSFKRERWRRISNYFDTVSPYAFGSGFIVDKRWWVVTGNPLSYSSSRNKSSLVLKRSTSSPVSVQVFDTINEAWVRNMRVDQRVEDAERHPRQYILLPPESRERICSHAKALLSPFDTTSASWMALGVFSSGSALYPTVFANFGCVTKTLADPPRISEEEAAAYEPTIDPYNQAAESLKSRKITGPRRNNNAPRTARSAPVKRRKAFRDKITRQPKEKPAPPKLEKVATEIVCREGQLEQSARHKEANWMDQFTQTFGDDNPNEIFNLAQMSI